MNVEIFDASSNNIGNGLWRADEGIMYTTTALTVGRCYCLVVENDYQVEIKVLAFLCNSEYEVTFC